MSSALESLRCLTEEVEQAGADIAPTYAEYVQLAFAIATDCGEEGRTYFIRLCRLSAKFDVVHADRLFTNVLKNGRDLVHLGTAFMLAQRAGVTVEAWGGQPEKCKNAKNAAAAVLTRARGREDNASVADGRDRMTGSEPSVPLPTFARHEWPSLMERVLGFASSDVQRDVLMLSTIATLGASLSHTLRFLYGGKYYYPCLQLFVVAPPASGKGIMAFVRQFADPIHKELRQKWKEDMKAYERRMAEIATLGKERAKVEVPERPVNKMFLIAGDNTGTGILQNIIESDGTGLIFEPEADTITTAIGSDYGKWSDTLRKAFDHERLSYNRRGNGGEYRETDTTRLSVVLSGTPAQVSPLIPSPENGLFSRQVFYYMRAIHEWRDQIDLQDTDLEAAFASLGREWKRTLDRLKRQGVFTLRFTDSQKAEFNALFQSLYRRAGLANGRDMAGAVARMAINAVRMMEVLALLRSIDGEDGEEGVIRPSPLIGPDPDIPAENLADGIVPAWILSIRDDDFHYLLAQMNVLYEHTVHILSFLPTSEITRRCNSEQDRLFASLPPAFSRQDYTQAAQALELNLHTALSWLDRMAAEAVHVRRVGRGLYQKVED